MRGLAHVEEIHHGKGKHRRTAIVITELPYQLSKAGWIEKLAELVNEGKINGISDIRDESDRDGMIIRGEVKRDSDPKKNLDRKLRKIPMEGKKRPKAVPIIPKQIAPSKI